MESRALFEFGAIAAASPLLRAFGRGDNHPVLIPPGFLAGDSSTAPLRSILMSQGYWVHGWRLGRNLGPTPDVVDGLIDRIHDLHDRHDRKVSLIGWSLGGVYARELAWMVPEDVRMVITLGTPFRHHGATSVSWLYEDVTGQAREEMDETMRERMDSPPPVPSTAIYSRSDGVVNWRCSVERHGEFAENDLDR